jgi:hypothetical protein
MKSHWLVLLVHALRVFAGCSGNNSATKQDDSTVGASDSASASIEVYPFKNCCFGDLYLHTSLSADANIFGANLTP